MISFQQLPLGAEGKSPEYCGKPARHWEQIPLQYHIKIEYIDKINKANI